MRKYLLQNEWRLMQGTFLIPYLLCLLLCGLPLYFMEMLLGQYTGTSCTKVYARLGKSFQTKNNKML